MLAFGKGNLTLSSGDREEEMAMKAGSGKVQGRAGLWPARPAAGSAIG